jgi:hypothetical protein
VSLHGEPSGGTSVETERRARGKASMRGENGGEFPLLGHARALRILPRGAVATDGVWSLSCHHLWCHTHERW